MPTGVEALTQTLKKLSRGAGGEGGGGGRGGLFAGVMFVVRAYRRRWGSQSLGGSTKTNVTIWGPKLPNKEETFTHKKHPHMI